MHAGLLITGPPVQVLPSEKVDEVVTSCARYLFTESAFKKYLNHT